MSIFSDYKVGALSDFEFEQECNRMNIQDRWERAHMYDDYHTDDDDLVVDLGEEESAE